MAAWGFFLALITSFHLLGLDRKLCLPTRIIASYSLRLLSYKKFCYNRFTILKVYCLAGEFMTWPSQLRCWHLNCVKYFFLKNQGPLLHHKNFFIPLFLTLRLVMLAITFNSSLLISSLWITIVLLLSSNLHNCR